MQQPFASLLVRGIKTLETRPTRANYEGRLYIHASQSVSKKFYEEYYLADPIFRLIVNCIFLFEETGLGNDPVPFKIYKKAFLLGGIIGHCELGQSVNAFEMRERYSAEKSLADWEREWSLGDLSSDRWAWEINNPVEYSQLIPCKGTISPKIWDCSHVITPDTINRAFERKDPEQLSKLNALILTV